MRQLCLVYRALLIACVMSVSLNAHADTVFLKNGSELVGEVIEIAGGKLKIKTDFAETMDLDMANVAGVATEKAISVRTSDGEVKVGKLGYTADGGQTVTAVAEGAPARAVDVAAIKDSWRPGVDDPELAAAKAQAAANLPKWTVTLQAGLNGQSGNQEVLNINGRIDARRKSPDDLLHLFASGYYSVQNGARTQQEYIGGARYENNISDRLYWYLAQTVEHDEFENLKIRMITTGGLGYYFIKKEDHEFKGFIGAGYQHQTFQTGGGTDQGLLELGIDYSVIICEDVKYTNSTRYYPTFDRINDYRVTTENAIEVPVTKGKDWKLRAGVRHEFDDLPAMGADRLDTYYFLNLVWDVVQK